MPALFQSQLNAVSDLCHHLSTLWRPSTEELNHCCDQDVIFIKEPFDLDGHVEVDVGGRAPLKHGVRGELHGLDIGLIIGNLEGVRGGHPGDEALEIDEEVKRIIDESLERVRHILAKRRAALDAISQE